MSHEPRHKPLPTAVQRAIQEGFKPPTRGVTITATVGTATESNGIVREVTEDELSVPVELGHHDAVVYRLQRLEANDVELARVVGAVQSGLGSVQTDVAGMSATLKAIETYAGRADARAEREVQQRLEAERAERAARIAADAQVAAAALTARAAEVTAKASDRTADVDLAKFRVTASTKIWLALVGVASTALLAYLGASHLSIK